MTNEAGSSPLATTNDPADRSNAGEAGGSDALAAKAAGVASTGAAAAKDAASEAATQVKVVAGEAKRQVATVVDQARHELSQQADERTRQAAGGLRTLADQAQALADGRPAEAGPLAGYLGDAQQRVTAFAERLESGGPQGLLDDVTGFARRRPLVFLAAAAGAGFIVGRLARAGHAAQQSASSDAPPPTTTFDPPPALSAPPTLPDPALTSSVP
jgi:hypothetical protein